MTDLGAGAHKPQSTLRDASEAPGSADQKLRESLEQVSEIAGDLYDRAADWLNQSNHRNYGIAALVAAAGIVGYALGRSAANSNNRVAPSRHE